MFESLNFTMKSCMSWAQCNRKGLMGRLSNIMIMKQQQCSRLHLGLRQDSELQRNLYLKQRSNNYHYYKVFTFSYINLKLK